MTHNQRWLRSASILPNLAMPALTAAAIDPGSCTSSRVIKMLSSLVRSCSFSGLRIVAMTFQPLCWKYFAVAFPMPLLAPVMKIVFFK